MSWDNVWRLPRRDYGKEEIEGAFKKALAEVEGLRQAPPDPDLEEFAEDFAADEAGERRFELWLHVSEDCAEHADEEEPEEDDEYVGMLSVGTDDGDAWCVVVSSNDGQNHAIGSPIDELASRISVLLGGPDDCEPN